MSWVVASSVTFRLLVVQRYVQLVAQTVESAMSNVARVAEATQLAHGIVEATIAKAIAIRSQMESKVASLVAQVEASTAHVVNALSKCMKEVAAHTKEQTSCVVGTIVQQLDKEIEATAVSATVVSERHTRSAVDNLRDEVKAHLEQNRANFEQR